MAQFSKKLQCTTASSSKAAPIVAEIAQSLWCSDKVLLKDGQLLECGPAATKLLSTHHASETVTTKE